jgi:YVTN family beta-propeller protein
MTQGANMITQRIVSLMLSLPLLALAASKARVIQTNSAGDNLHVIDPANNQVSGVIHGIEVPHGVVIAPDGGRLYVTEEPTRTLDVVDSKSLKVTKRIPLSGRPNNLAVTNDGQRVYVGIAQPPGAVDVIDTVGLTNIKSISVDGAIHNVYVTPDGKYAVAGSIPTKVISVIDTGTNTLAWSVKLSGGIRPMAFTKNPDGSTKEIVAQLSDFHGFVLVDFRTHQEVKRVTLPDVSGQDKNVDGVQGAPSHGLAVTPDGKILWATSKWFGYVAAYSLPDLSLLKVIPVGLIPEWLTIPPDGKNLYVAVAGLDQTVVVNNKTMQVVARIPVGYVPKRNASGLLQTE